MALILSNAGGGSSTNPLLNLADDTYQSIVSLGTIQNGSIVSGTPIAIENAPIIFNIKSFKTATTAAQAIQNNTRFSVDGETWVTATQGTGNAENYNYAMSLSGSTGFSITFTT